MQTLKKFVKGLILSVLVVSILALGATRTYARLVYFSSETVNGSYTSIRCADGAYSGDFTLNYDGITGTYETFALTRAEAAQACGY